MLFNHVNRNNKLLTREFRFIGLIDGKPAEITVSAPNVIDAMAQAKTNNPGLDIKAIQVLKSEAR